MTFVDFFSTVARAREIREPREISLRIILTKKKKNK